MLSARELPCDDLADAAQAVYDCWSQDDSDDDDRGEGGICDLIAEAMVKVLHRHGLDAEAMVAQHGDVHVFVLCRLRDGVHSIDVAPDLYEKGSGSTWRKVPGVQFDEEDIIIELVDKDLDAFEEMTAE